MRHHILPLLLLPLTFSLPLTTATITAQIRPSFHTTCPSTSTTSTTTTTTDTSSSDTSTTLHPRTHHIPIAKPIPLPHHPHPHPPGTIPLHPNTCQSIPIPDTSSPTTTTTHVSFDTQIQGSGTGTGSGTGGVEYCNVTLHEYPGCVDTPFLVSRVDGEEGRGWVGSGCAARGASSGTGAGVGNGNGGVWVLLECEDLPGGAGGKDKDTESESEASKGGIIHGGEESQNGDDTTGKTQEQDDNKVTPLGSIHGGLLNSTALHGANWNATMGKMNMTAPVMRRMLGRRDWRRRFLRY
ncbi:uncharacterized protein BO80DRAFT_504670 [Aspergillus ibericus CBS 121593]|uniref:Uncharacterized protein n=1 Tax=Aspergillus ibericus CBS 121593 TaxID=1448316 RepID=A0A395GR70_9EURO|nr:hypothetical protein BO80DRAFT_504670 [Aspergillus ibericus CBS 121593]RAK97458.1 hypothetical protein BO80DRAFT_504670 [Aspergillus ibericus CBS 121593]